MTTTYFGSCGRAIAGAALVTVLAGAAMVAAGAGRQHQMPAPMAGEAESKKAFERLKGLVGTWEGSAGEHGEGMDVRVEYRLSGGGHTLMEFLFPGTEHEMLSVYTLDGDRIVMTHYCSLGNQPRMAATSFDNPDVIKFEFLDAMNLASPEAEHIHGLTMHLTGPDTARADWVFYKDGKEAGHADFRFKREKKDAAGG